MNKGVLILNALPDIETDFIVRKLSKKEIPFFRLNSFTLDSQSLTYHLKQKHFTSKLPFRITEPEVIWNRLPFSAKGITSEKNSVEENFSQEESYWFLRNMGETIPDAVWVNHPSLEEEANCKIIQLQKAVKVGLTYPETLFTNSLRGIKKFKKEQGDIVFKPLFHSGQLDDSGISIFTSLVKEENLEKFPPYLNYPGTFQEYIPKEYDLRVVVMGDKIHPIAIYSKDIKEARIDWRRADFSKLECKAVKLHPDLEESCRELCKDFGIYTAAIDFAVDKKGKHYFLDLNPGGRWLQFEIASKEPISDSLVDLLSNLSPKSSYHKKVYSS